MDKHNKGWKKAPHQRPHTGPRLTSEQKQQLVLDTVNRASHDEPLTLKGVSVGSNLNMDDVKFILDRMVSSGRVAVRMIPDLFYPQQKVRAFYKKI